MKIQLRFLALLIACLIGSQAVCAAQPAAVAPQRLTILHTNDVHGHLRPFSYPAITSLRNDAVYAGGMQSASLLAAFGLETVHDIGGIARRATMATRIRADLAKSATPVWMIDGGDFFYYSAFSNEYHGDGDVLAMNAAGYDFATLGNHEFEITLPQLKKLISDAHFQFLCANVTDNATHQPLTKPYEIRQVGPLRVGIFGLVESGVGRSEAGNGGLTAQDPLTVAQATVTELRERQKADVIVLISHLGDSLDQQLALKVPGIDVILGAHWHTRLPQGKFIPWSDELKTDEVNGTVFVQAGQWGGDLGRLDLLFAKNAAGKWRVSRWEERLLPVTGATPEDPGVNAVLDKLWAPIAAKYGEALGTATADFSERADDNPQVNLYADLIRAELGVDFEFEGTGGVHWPLVAGPVTRELLVDLDQSKTTIVTFRMKGSEIRKFVERSTPVASGLRYRVYLGKLQSITAGDAPLDDARAYTCAMNSYLARRVEEFETLDKKDTGKSWAEAVLAAMRKVHSFTPAYDGRRIVVSNPRTPR